MSLRYRADIDGLRAVAVMAVVLFHANWGIPGGFVGVDVFFVISGYLITSLLREDLDQGTFSLARFWERRIRRIWPAAFAATLGVVAAGWVVLLPRDFLATVGDAMAQTAMLANVRFVRHAIDGYFAESADLRPLLHMWSLAVEEQFYVVLPLVLAWCWPWGRRWCVGILCCGAMASLIASHFMLPTHPNEVFFLSPFRAWELLAGALLALMPPPVAWRWNHMPEWLAGIGSTLVLVPMVAYSRETPFPGLAAVPPCLGTALVIAAGASPGRSSLISRLLGTAGLVAIGRISYSLYLWHWPVLALLRYCLGSSLSVAVTAAGLAAATVVSIASWRFIEQPFRRMGGQGDCRRASIAPTMLVAASAAGAIISVSMWIRWGDGMPSRFEPSLVQFVDSCEYAPGAGKFIQKWPLEAGSRIRLPPLGAVAGIDRAEVRPTFLLWGDSHAMCIVTAFDEEARRMGIVGAAAILPATIPVPDAWWPASRWGAAGPAASRAWSCEIVDWIRTRRPRNVILCAAWSSYVPAAGAAGIEAIDGTDGGAMTPAGVLRHGLESLARECARAGTRLWVLEDVPFQSTTARARAVVAHLRGRDIDLRGVGRATHERQQADAAEVIRSCGDHLRVVDLAAPFFDAQGVSSVGKAGRSWYVDGSHVTQLAVDQVLGDTIRGILTEMARDSDRVDEELP